MSDLRSDSVIEKEHANIALEVRRLILISAAILAAFFGVLGLWSVITELYGAVVAQGVIKVEANVKLVQHVEGGVVKRIFVKEGQHVRLGDLILELEDTEANASLAMASDQLDAELAKLARLRAEMSNFPTIQFPPELSARYSDPSIKTLLKNEEHLFNARIQMLGDQLGRMREQKKAVLAEIASLTNQIQAADKSLVYLLEQEKMNESLHAQNFVANTRLLDVRRSTAEKEEKKFEFESIRAQAQQKLADLELRLSSLALTRLNENSRDFVESQNKIANLRERVRPAKEILERKLVRSPATGIVNILRAHTQGGVVSPRDQIAEVVPDQSRLLAEVRVNPSDIDEVHEGQEVEIELSGLNRRATPLLRGSVSFVSPDLNTDQANPAVKYFVVRVGFATDNPRQVTVSPGMPVAAYIRTKKRSPLELWLDPITSSIRKSFRET